MRTATEIQWPVDLSDINRRLPPPKKIPDRTIIQIPQIQILWDSISFIVKFQFNKHALSEKLGEMLGKQHEWAFGKAALFLRSDLSQWLQ